MRAEMSLIRVEANTYKYNVRTLTLEKEERSYPFKLTFEPDGSLILSMNIDLFENTAAMVLDGFTVRYYCDIYDTWWLDVTSTLYSSMMEATIDVPPVSYEISFTEQYKQLTWTYSESTLKPPRYVDYENKYLLVEFTPCFKKTVLYYLRLAPENEIHVRLRSCLKSLRERTKGRVPVNVSKVSPEHLWFSTPRFGIHITTKPTLIVRGTAEEGISLDLDLEGICKLCEVVLFLETLPVSQIVKALNIISKQREKLFSKSIEQILVILKIFAT